MKPTDTNDNESAQQPATDQPCASPKDMRATFQQGGSAAVMARIDNAEEWDPEEDSNEDQPENQKGDKPWVKMPCDGHSLGDFSRDLGESLKRANIYRRGESAFKLSKATGKLVMLEAQNFRTLVESHVSLCKVASTSNGPVNVKCSMDIETARGVCASPLFLDQLPALKMLMPTRMPVIRKSGALELLDSGYDEETQTLTNPKGCTYPDDTTIDEAKVILDRVLGEFPFADKRSEAVAVAAMLTVYGSGLLPDLSLFPCFIYQANAEGSGKTTLAKIAGVPYGIVAAQAAPANTAEWQKRLLVMAMSGTRVALLDNIRGHLNSPALEAYLTATTYSDRILGVSTEFSGRADTVFLMTGNRLTVTADLRRRALFVELFMHELRSEDRVFRRCLDDNGILKEQPNILGALWAIIRNWDEKGRPAGSSTNASFASWCKIIGGIVESAGYACPTLHAELTEGGDTDTRDIAKLAGEMDVECAYTFAELIKICVKHELFERFIEDTDLLGQPSKKARSGIAKIFKVYDRRHVAPGKLLVAKGTGHARRYELVAESN